MFGQIGEVLMEFEAFKKRIWLATATQHGEEIKYIQEAFDTNWITTEGANIAEIERKISEKVGCKYAVALSSGTAALHIAVKLAGVKAGDTVFCTDMTFDATVNAIVYEGPFPYLLIRNTILGIWTRWLWKRPSRFTQIPRL